MRTGLQGGFQIWHSAEVCHQVRVGEGAHKLGLCAAQQTDRRRAAPRQEHSLAAADVLDLLQQHLAVLGPDAAGERLLDRQGKTAIGNVYGRSRHNFMHADMPAAAAGYDPTLRRGAGQQGIGGVGISVRHGKVIRAVTHTVEVHPCRAGSQCVVERAVLQIGAAANAEAKAVGVDELFILGADGPMVHAVLPHREHRDMSAVVADEHVGFVLPLLYRVRNRCVRRCPERMVGGQRQKQERLKGPVGTAGGIVLLAHEQVRVLVPDGQHARRVGDGVLEPVVQVGQHGMAHRAPGDAFILRTCKRIGRKECCVGEAVGQTAAKRNLRAVICEPLDEIPGKFAAAGLKSGRAAIGIQRGECRPDERVKVHGKGDIVIHLAGVTVKIPAAAGITMLDNAKIILQLIGVIGQPQPGKGHIR